MAHQVVITCGSAVSKGAYGPAPVRSAYPRWCEEFLSSGTSQQSAAAVGADDVITVDNTAGTVPIWVKVGADPTAAVEDALFVPAGAVVDFGDLRAGHLVAIIEDS